MYSDWKRLTNRALFSMMLFFSIWVLLDAVIWATESPDVIMFTWSIQVFFDLLIYVAAAFFVYFFAEMKMPPWWAELVFFSLFIPIFLLVSSRWNLSHFDMTNCDREASEGFLWQYVYAVETLITLGIIAFSSFKFFRSKDPIFRRKTALLTMGVILFLVSFSLGNLVGSFTEDWSYGQYGLFGMPILALFIAYLIVRYRILNAKLIATQVLIVTLVVLIGSQLFFINTGKVFLNFVLVSITFFLAIIFGILLIRSVQGEIRRKEELQTVTNKLAAANVELKRLDQSKTEFISIASHQLRTPLTAIKGFVSLLLEGSYGPVTPQVADVLNKVYTANDRIVHLVEDLLNISRMESGRLKYDCIEVNIPEFLNELRDTFALSAKKKGLELVFEPREESLPAAWIDRQKAFEVVSNLIDNAIKYTVAGSVRVRAENIPDFVRISITDTGVGIDADTMSALFRKFSRGKEGGKMHVSGTGLGLYVGKSMIEAQGGHIGVTSEGSGKGSTFFVELPVKKG